MIDTSQQLHILEQLKVETGAEVTPAVECIKSNLNTATSVTWHWSVAGRTYNVTTIEDSQPGTYILATSCDPGGLQAEFGYLEVPAAKVLDCMCYIVECTAKGDD